MFSSNRPQPSRQTHDDIAVNIVNTAMQFLANNVTATHFDPRRKEKIFPSLFLGLIQNSARSCILVGKNGNEPTIGNEDIAGGNLRPPSPTLCRR